VVAHLVLLKPRATLGEDERNALLESMRVAFAGIPEIKRVRIGKVMLGDLPLSQWRYLGPDEKF